METSLEIKFIECLDALEKGESVDKILDRYPYEADQLRSMLQTAVHLSHLNVQPSLAAKAHSRNAFLTEAAAQKEAKIRPFAWLNWHRILRPMAALAMILIVFGAMLAPLSAAALPGDTFYGAKRFIEDTRLFFTSDPAGKAAFNEQFDQRRIQEINMLLAANRDAQVSFEGTIESIQPDVWIVAGLSLQITDDTQILGGDPVVGQGAMVNGRTQSGSLIANTVTLSAMTQLPAPTPTPSPTAAPTVTPSSTPTTTPTTAPTATPEPTKEVIPPTVTPSPTTEPSPTAVIQPTDTPAPPPPTAVPDPGDDDGGDNNDDGGDDDNNDDGGDNNDDGGGDDNNDGGGDNNDNGGDDNNDDGGDDDNNDDGGDDNNDNEDGDNNDDDDSET